MAGSSWDWNLVPCLCRGQLVSVPYSLSSERLTLIFFPIQTEIIGKFEQHKYTRRYSLKNPFLNSLLLNKLVVERHYHCMGMSNVPGAPKRILQGHPPQGEAMCSMIRKKINETLYTKKGLVVGLFHLKIFTAV